MGSSIKAKCKPVKKYKRACEKRTREPLKSPYRVGRYYDMAVSPTRSHLLWPHQKVSIYPTINYPFFPAKVCMNLLLNCFLCQLNGPEVSPHFCNYKKGIKQCYWRIHGPSFLSLVLHSGPFSLTKVCTKYRILVIKSNNLKYNALVY